MRKGGVGGCATESGWRAALDRPVVGGGLAEREFQLRFGWGQSQQALVGGAGLPGRGGPRAGPEAGAGSAGSRSGGRLWGARVAEEANVKESEGEGGGPTAETRRRSLQARGARLVSGFFKLRSNSHTTKFTL